MRWGSELRQESGSANHSKNSDPGAACLRNSWCAGLLVKEEIKLLTFCFRNDNGNFIITITHIEKQNYHFYHFRVLVYNRGKIQNVFVQSKFIVQTFITHKIRRYYFCLHRAYQSSVLSQQVSLKCHLIKKTSWSLLPWNKTRQAVKSECSSQIEWYFFSYLYEDKLRKDDRYLWWNVFWWEVLLCHHMLLL